MRRREFISLLGGAVGWPLAVRAQQPAKLPVIGFLTGGSPRLSADAAFVQGLREAGYVERQNVMIEYRWARGAYERPPDLAAELIALRVHLIAAFAIPAARAAKTVSVKSTPAIPVVFSRCRSGRGRAGREPQSAGWQFDRRHQHRQRARIQAAGAVAQFRNRSALGQG
jgi:putative tryptophan/tyrosine transport system substrate-binding protein